MTAPVSAPLLETPLAAAHRKAGARMVEFGGWSMPVFYTSILDEHQAVRTGAGLFDISHMGEFMIEGPAAAAFLNSLLTNDIERLRIGDGQYTLMLNGQGGVIDDLIIYRADEEAFFLVVNASKIDEDRAWIESRLPGEGVVFADKSASYAAVALQGPKSDALLADLGWPRPPRNGIVPARLPFLAFITRTGYTGEDGFEIFCEAASAEALWDRLIAAGAKPAGLGCRDTLRLESCYPLNGNDLSPERTPLEAGLGIFVSLTKEADFPGKARLVAQKADGVAQRLVALRPVEKSAPPRSHYKLFAGEKLVGEVTSGGLSPTLGHGIALAYVEAEYAKPGQRLDLEVRERRSPVEVVPKPFYKRS
ncbi:aminomethyltransferase [Verrucomicrobium sp. GAS474]|uniref:glycine cleavage system aminomethyltransferase GcvT n=1 Tax=Verrucomicrobium sp. GAS474 TaxID=1882831 RepID=UPI00087A0821|nr:glycine cleavage system aminomethyltransferase GcvT [Verrucomicrobium sp. GAS474]SDU22349.1 aminomethyltransferase [Verrucomicrobium sp. GAS474]